MYEGAHWIMDSNSNGEALTILQDMESRYGLDFTSMDYYQELTIDSNRLTSDKNYIGGIKGEGMGINDLQFTIYSNFTYLLNVPIALNLISNEILRNHNINEEINVYYHPLVSKPESYHDLDDLKLIDFDPKNNRKYSDIFLIISVCIILSLPMSIYGPLTIKEREDGIVHQLFLNGTKRINYWIGVMVSDLATFTIPIIIITLIINISGTFIFSFIILPFTLVVIFLWMVASLLYQYVISYVFKKYENISAFLIILNTIICVITGIYSYNFNNNNYDVFKGDGKPYNSPEYNFFFYILLFLYTPSTITIFLTKMVMCSYALSDVTKIEDVFNFIKSDEGYKILYNSTLSYYDKSNELSYAYFHRRHPTIIDIIKSDKHITIGLLILIFLILFYTLFLYFFEQSKSQRYRINKIYSIKERKRLDQILMNGPKDVYNEWKKVKESLSNNSLNNKDKINDNRDHNEDNKKGKENDDNKLNEKGKGKDPTEDNEKGKGKDPTEDNEKGKGKDPTEDNEKGKGKDPTEDNEKGKGKDPTEDNEEGKGKDPTEDNEKGNHKKNDNMVLKVYELNKEITPLSLKTREIKEILIKKSSSENVNTNDNRIIYDKNNKKFINRVIDDISFGVNDGECLGLLGPNGSGKTTIISMITGIRSHTHGQVFFREKDLNKSNLVDLSLGYCSQNDALWESLTIRETIEFYLNICGHPKENIPRYTRALVEICGIEKHIKKKVSELSGGTRRKLSLIISICSSPRYLILDEPSTGIDAFSRRYMWKLVNELRKTCNTSIILTTQSTEEAEALCDRIAILIKGRLVCINTPSILKMKHNHRYTLDVFTHSPQEFEAFVKENNLFGLEPEEDYQVESTSIGYQKYFVKMKTENIPNVFLLMEKAKEERLINQYNFGQYSLEQIFNHLINTIR